MSEEDTLGTVYVLGVGTFMFVLRLTQLKPLFVVFFLFLFLDLLFPTLPDSPASPDTAWSGVSAGLSAAELTD